MATKNNELAIVERQIKDGWKVIKFQHLKIGNVFRLRSPDTRELHINLITNKSNWTVYGNPYKNDDGIWAVRTTE